MHYQFNLTLILFKITLHLISGWEPSALACCFLGRVNFDASFCYSRLCNKATRAQRCGLFYVLFCLPEWTPLLFLFWYFVVLTLFHSLTISFGVVIYLPGFTHKKKKKEYGPMLTPGLQDGTSMSFVISFHLMS